jgi:hypothetical protein
VPAEVFAAKAGAAATDAATAQDASRAAREDIKADFTRGVVLVMGVSLKEDAHNHTGQRRVCYRYMIVILHYAVKPAALRNIGVDIAIK